MGGEGSVIEEFCWWGGCLYGGTKLKRFADRYGIAPKKQDKNQEGLRFIHMIGRCYIRHALKKI